jgi:queuine tRNA-ribosyltransferase
MFFKVLCNDGRTKARVGEVTTEHGVFQTPVFMPVGTQGTVKAMEPRELEELGASILLGNAYHLHLRPGTEVLERAGGLHKFMNWNKPLLTDSGGFQVFSLSGLRKVTDDGVEFQSHIDGSTHFFSPESVIRTQRSIGSDIMMVLDECLENPVEEKQAAESVALTSSWAKRARQEFKGSAEKYGYRQYLFGIIQGSTFTALRKRSAEDLKEIGFDGYALGGLAVGEENQLMYDIVQYSAELMPEDKPRYLMGVGTPEDLLNAVERGMDMFDCVIPTRNARNGTLFTSRGKIRLKNLENKFNFNSPDENSDSYTARNFTVAYLRHLFISSEILAAQLATLHNLRFYFKLMEDVRQAIRERKFSEFKKSFLEKYCNSKV